MELEDIEEIEESCESSRLDMVIQMDPPMPEHERRIKEFWDQFDHEKIVAEQRQIQAKTKQDNVFKRRR